MKKLQLSFFRSSPPKPAKKKHEPVSREEGLRRCRELKEKLGLA